MTDEERQTVLIFRFSALARVRERMGIKDWRERAGGFGLCIKEVDKRLGELGGRDGKFLQLGQRHEH